MRASVRNVGIGLLVVAAHKAGGGRIASAPHHMLQHAKARGFPRHKKPLSMRKAAKRDTEPVTPQDAVEFGKSRRKPGIGIIIGDTPSVPRFIAHEIRRIREHQIHAASRQLGQHGEAVTGNHLIKKRVG